MAIKEAITIENVFDVDIKKLAMDSRFGSLVFENANEKLSKIQGWLKEARDLKYEELLLESDAALMTTNIKTLVERLQWLNNFDISAIGNIKQEHDNFERQVDAFHKTVYQQVVMKYLPFLREERRRENPDEKKLEEEVRKASQLRSELENELKSVRADVEKIKTTEKDVGSAKGERAAVNLATHFVDEVDRYQGNAYLWFKSVVFVYIVIVLVLIWFSVPYLFPFLCSKVSLLSCDATSSIEAGVAKLILIAALWYGLSFVTKNYYVNSHLAAVNRHRAAVARSLEDFIALERQQENPRLAEILQNATEAMFKNAPVGFISKAEKETESPVLKIINDIIGARSK